MFDAADLAAFVDPSMPGYVLASINGQPVGGLFRARYAESFGLIGGTAPTLRCIDSLVVSSGDSVVISGQNYIVAEKETAEPGFLLLKLETP